MKLRILFSPLAMLLFSVSAFVPAKKREFYAIRVYHLQSPAQEQRTDNYLQDALLPALHRHGISNIGVFKPLENDAAPERRIYVVIPLRSADQYISLSGSLDNDAAYRSSGKEYLDAVYTDPPYKRMENILLQAFEGMPALRAPELKNAPGEKVYELRSYESATEKIHMNKVEMFNAGGEFGIFSRLGFNTVFCASVLSGSNMPNLMYMTSFESKADRDKHWEAFKADPEWKALAAVPKYQKNVSRSESILMHAAAYSDY